MGSLAGAVGGLRAWPRREEQGGFSQLLDSDPGVPEYRGV